AHMLAAPRLNLPRSVLKIFVAVSDRPDAGQVRLAIRSLRHRSREVRFSVGRPRNPRCGVMQPLRGERRRQHSEDYREHDRFHTVPPAARTALNFASFDWICWYRY